MGKNFVKETKSELKKVIWPSRQQVVNGTGVVIAMVAIVGVIILGFDFVSGFAIQKIMEINPSESKISVEQQEQDEDIADDVTDTDNTDVIPDSDTEEGNGEDVADIDSAE